VGRGGGHSCRKVLFAAIAADGARVSYHREVAYTIHSIANRRKRGGVLIPHCHLKCASKLSTFSFCVVLSSFLRRRLFKVRCTDAESHSNRGEGRGQIL
jgi:hypothetical protein